MTFIHLSRFSAILTLILLTANCQPAGKDKLFTLLPASATGVQFANNLNEDDRFNIIKYLYYYNGGGVAVGDVNNDDLPDIFFTANQLSNQLYINKGNFGFEDVTEKAGLADVASPGQSWKTGVTMADVNADGWLDIYVCEVGFYKSVNGRNRLYINNQDGTFSEKATEFGLDFKGFAQQACFFDYDLDGDLDCFLATHSVHSAESYAKAEQRSVRDSLAGDYLFRNDGGRFTDVSEPAGIYGGSMGYALGVVVSDLNNDGWPDLYVTNDFHENDYLYLNSAGQPESPQSAGGGEARAEKEESRSKFGIPNQFRETTGNEQRAFREVIASATGHTSTFCMGVDAADLNNDGLTDLMTLDMKPEQETVLKASAGADHFNLYQMKLNYGYHFQYPRNCLQVGAGPVGGLPHFDEIGELAGVAATDWSWGTLLADLDNDGWKDIFITNGIWRRPNDLDYLRFASDKEVQRNATDLELAAKMPQGFVPNYAFRNKLGRRSGEQRGSEWTVPVFENVAEKWGLDLTGCSNGAAYADFDNDGDLDLVVNNLNAPAALYRNNSEVFSKNNYLKIRLKGDAGNPFGLGAKVTIKSGGLTQMQELSPTRGWQSSSDYVLNFGLGKNETAEEVKIIWPGGREQLLINVAANQQLTVLYAASSVPGPQPQVQQLQHPIYQLSNLPVYHKENRFVDFNVEPLMPHMLSTQGPKLAVGDVNGDGLDDFYLCGAKAQTGQLVIGTPDGWEPRDQVVFEEDFLCEDVDATFFDADMDGDPDLFVVSGGGEYRDGAPQLEDRLYLNDGKGGFVKSSNTWPATNGSCVVAGDFNGDGTEDLFIGSRSVVGSYGLTPQSFIFLNDGKGNFRDATAEICPEMARAGMVTTGVWLTEERRLIIAGEWMPVTVVDLAETPTASVHRLAQSSGWWNVLSAADMDGDGDLDLLAGNLGLNTNLTASPEEPVELFVKDFENNGATEPILTYYRQGKCYTVGSKDELVGQLPDLKKRFVDYARFANCTFEQVFDEKMREGAVHKQVETFASMYFENQGNGKFKSLPMPVETQTFPFYTFLPGDFDKDGLMDALAAGNFYTNQPSTGRSDASSGWVLKGDGKGHFTPQQPGKHHFFVAGETRDLKFAKGANLTSQVLAAKNNEAVQVINVVQ